MGKANSPADWIFGSVIEIATTEGRAAYLDQACGDDLALRRHLDKLLDAHFRAGSFLDGPGPALLATTEQPITEGAGTIIGPYKLLGQIGVGGFGVVFMAEQQRPVRRKVALKVIKPGMDTHQVIARFEAERQALALMEHPNIARVLDAGATASGRPYFVMELVKGLPITDYCDQHQITPRERLELFVHVCQAVQHAHQKGIIHRDLKPSNVLVTEHDGTPVVKVIDFGIAKATGQQLTDKTLFTNLAQMVGTPLYMSPEQAGISGLDIDTRSDIYSLGVLLYELLTGSTPFDKERLRDASFEEIRRIIREEEPAKPSTRISTLAQAASTVSAQRQCDPRRLRDLVRGDLDWIVMRALEKDRTRRYETANEFARDIQRYLHDEPVEACPPSALYRFRKFARRNKRALALTASVLAMLVLGASGWMWVYHLERTSAAAINERTAQIEREKVTRQATTKLRVDETLDRAKELIGKGNWPEAMALAKRAEGILESSGRDPELQRRVRELLGDLGMVARLEEIRLQKSDVKDGHFDDAQADANYARAFREYGIDVLAFDPQEAADRVRAHSIRVELAVALEDWAWVCRFTRDRKDETWKQLLAVAQAADCDIWRNQVRDAWQRGDGKALEHLAASDRVTTLPPSTLHLLARAQVASGSLEKAVGLLRRAQQQHPGDFWINHQLAYYLRLITPPERGEVIRYYTAAVSLRPQSPGVYLNLGLALADRGCVDEASAAYRKAIRLKPDYAAAHNGLGNTLSKQNKLDEAIAEYRLAIQLAPMNALPHNGLGNALCKQNKLDEAIAEFCQAIQLDPNYALPHNGLGNALCKQNKLDEAIAEYRLAIQVAPMDASPHNGLGNALCKQNKLDEAIAEFCQAIQLDSNYALPHNGLGNALCKQNKLDEASAAYRKAIRLKPDFAEAHNGLGNALSEKNKLGEAIPEYRLAIQLDPNHAAPHNGLGNALSKQNKLDEAIAEYRLAIQLDPNYACAHYNLGKALSTQNKLDEAIAEYRLAIEVEPKFALAHYNLGNALYRQNKVDAAIAEFRLAIGLEPNFPDAHTNLGSALYHQKKLDAAIAEFRLAIKVDRKHVLANNGLGLALVEQGKQDNLDEAIAAFRMAIQVNRKYAGAYYNLGRALRRQKKLDDAIEAYRMAIRVKPDYAEAHCNLGGVLEKQGHFTDALAAFRRGHDLGSRMQGWSHPSAQWIRHCKRLVELDKKLAKVLRGEAKPEEAAEQIEFASICQMEARQLYGNSVRFYEEAFRTQADLEPRHRYNAACAAALAGDGQGKDEAAPDEQARARYRKRALAWLRADLVRWAKQLEKPTGVARAATRKTLEHWQRDSDLASMRDAKALAKVSEAERDACRRLWAAVDSLLEKAARDDPS